MGQTEISAMLVPIFSVFALAVVGVIGRAILKRLPEGRLKRILGWSRQRVK